MILLGDPKYFEIPKEEIGAYTTDIFFYPMPFALVGSILIGFFFNIFGRRLAIFISCLMCTICIVLVPYTSPNYFYLVLNSVMLGTFIVPLITVPLSNDYVKTESMGLATSIKSLGFNFAQLFVFAVMF
jgi:predicted MFS family arabinose efflux permease